MTPLDPRRRADRAELPASAACGSCACSAARRCWNSLGPHRLGLRPHLDLDGLGVRLASGGQPHGRLGGDHQLARRRGGPAGQLDGGGDHVVGHRGAPARCGRPPSASTTSPNRVIAAAPCGPSTRCSHPGVAAAGVQAERQEPGVEPGPRSGQPQVAGQGQVQPGADRGAVDRGDRRQRALGDGRGTRRRPCAAWPGRPRASSARSPPAQNAGSSPVITIAPTPSSAAREPHGVDELPGQLRCSSRCAARGLDDGEHGDAVGDLGADVGGHDAHPAASAVGARRPPSRRVLAHGAR